MDEAMNGFGIYRCGHLVVCTTTRLIVDSVWPCAACDNPKLISIFQANRIRKEWGLNADAGK